MQACRIAKLFAKHFKVPEQQEVLEKEAVGIACGTPHRLCKLADLDALKLDNLRLLVLDVHLDAKQRCEHTNATRLPGNNIKSEKR